MANYTSTANVVLSVNGKQAQKMLSTLEKDAQRLEKQLAKAATAGRIAATANAVAGGRTSVPMARGFYIVRAAGTSRAVVVQ